MKTKITNFLKHAYWLWGLIFGIILMWSISPMRYFHFEIFKHNTSFQLDKFLTSLIDVSYMLEPVFIVIILIYGIFAEVGIRLIKWYKKTKNSLPSVLLAILIIIFCYFLFISYIFFILDY